VEHLSEIAARRFEGGLVGIRCLRLFGVYVISPPAGGTFPPPSRNVLPCKIAGGVGHPKQTQKKNYFLQLKCSPCEQRSSLGQKWIAERPSETPGHGSGDVWQKCDRIVRN